MLQCVNWTIIIYIVVGLLNIIFYFSVFYSFVYFEIVFLVIQKLIPSSDVKLWKYYVSVNNVTEESNNKIVDNSFEQNDTWKENHLQTKKVLSTTFNVYLFMLN